jgi:hypothetical protein
VSYDDMVKLYNQVTIYIGNKDFMKNFWDSQAFLQSLLPNWKKYQKVWNPRKSSIKIALNKQICQHYF